MASATFMASLLYFTNSVLSSPKKFNRGLSEGQLNMVKQIEASIKAQEWQEKDGWIHHDPYNIIDAFGLEYDIVHEARREAMEKQKLTQID